MFSKKVKNFLNPEFIKRKNNSEVFTDDYIINDLYDLCFKYEEDLYSNKDNKFLDMSGGMGYFLFILIEQLMKNINIENSEERYKYIIENMIYVSEIDEVNYYILYKELSQNGKYKPNIFLGDTLSKDFKNNMKDIWKIERFTHSITNPPYNAQLYKKFLNCSIEISNVTAFVIPSNWLINVSSIMLRKLLKNNYFVDMYVKGKQFPGVDTETMYIYINKNMNKKIYINSIDISDFKSNMFFNVCNDFEKKIYYKILEKKDKYKLNNGKNKTLNYHSEKETDDIKFKESNAYSKKLLSRLGGGEHKIYYCKELIPEPGNKLCFPKGTENWKSISNLKNTNRNFMYSICINEDIYISKSIRYIQVENKNEGDFVQYYLFNSNISRFILIKENRLGEFHKGLLDFLPKIDYKKYNPTNNDIYNFFNFTEEERKYINDYINN